MRGLYAIIDVAALSKRGISVYAFTEAVVSARPAAVQLRDKGGDARRMLATLRCIAPLTEAAGVPLFANDRPDLALLAGCDGVHVGQDDVPISVVRASIASQHARLSVGVSTHNETELHAAAAEDPDYVAIGPIFATANKDNPSPVLGLEVLRMLRHRLRGTHPGLPVVAIGGITQETAASIGRLCCSAAVIGALLPQTQGKGALTEVADRAVALHQAILQGHAEAEAERTRALANSGFLSTGATLPPDEHKGCA